MGRGHVVRWAEGVLPLDCPGCGRHRLEYGLNENGHVVFAECGKCSWNSDLDDVDDEQRTRPGAVWTRGRWLDAHELHQLSPEAIDIVSIYTREPHLLAEAAALYRRRAELAAAAAQALRLLPD